MCSIWKNRPNKCRNLYTFNSSWQFRSSSSGGCSSVERAERESERARERGRDSVCYGEKKRINLEKVEMYCEEGKGNGRGRGRSRSSQRRRIFLFLLPLASTLATTNISIKKFKRSTIWIDTGLDSGRIGEGAFSMRKRFVGNEGKGGEERR